MIAHSETLNIIDAILDYVGDDGKLFSYRNKSIYETHISDQFGLFTDVHLILLIKEFEWKNLITFLKSKFYIHSEQLVFPNILIFKYNSFSFYIVIDYQNKEINDNHIKNLCRITLDAIFYNYKTKEIEDISTKYLEDISPSIKIKLIDDGTDLSVRDIFHILNYICHIKTFYVHENLRSILQLLNLNDKTLSDQHVIDLVFLCLKSPYPYNVVDFIDTHSKQNKNWILNIFLEYANHLNVRINEKIDLVSFFSQEKKDLINSYNYARLISSNKESDEDLRNRSEQTLKILFDTPSLSLPALYLNKITPFGSGTGRCCVEIDYYQANTPGSPNPNRLVYTSYICVNNVSESQCSSSNCNEILAIAVGGNGYYSVYPPGQQHPVDCSFIWDQFCFVPPYCNDSAIFTKWCEDTQCPASQAFTCNPVLNPDVSPTDPAACGGEECTCGDFGGNYCPNGNCSDCVPANCVANGGEACCCCSSVDIVNSIRTRCYDKVLFSCNKDGTAPGPPSENCECEDFATSCDACFEACEMALEINGHVCSDIYGGKGSPPDWWTFPPEVGPCECTCRQPSGTGCNLTCVTCNESCLANVNIISSNCNYQFAMTPGEGCCGESIIIQIVVVVDITDPSIGYAEDVGDHISNIWSNLESEGFRVNAGIVTYGHTSTIKNNAKIHLPITDSRDEFVSSYNSLTFGGNTQPSFTATSFALQNFQWNGAENLILLVSNSDTECSNCPKTIGHINDHINQPSAKSLADYCAINKVRFFAVDNEDFKRKQLADLAGGKTYNIGTNFVSLLRDEISIVPGLSSSCDCLDYTPILVEMCTQLDNNGDCVSSTTNIPIRKCTNPDNSDCRCADPYILEVCGEIVIIEPDPNTINIVCCHEIEGSGCLCDPNETPPEGCCGISCQNLGNICEIFNTKEDAINNIWCECWEKARTGIDGFSLPDPNCTSCVLPPIEDSNYENILHCCVQVPDGNGGFNLVCRDTIVQEVESAWTTCSDDDGGGGDDGGGDDGGGGTTNPPPSWTANCNPTCDRQDNCINSDNEFPNRCDNNPSKCISFRNPSVTVLNNGIGLVAYESSEDISVIKIQQFNTSLRNKLLPNRILNFGRLQNNSKWVGAPKIAKLYYYDDNIPVSVLNGISTLSDLSTWQDSISFKNGPLKHQCFPLYAENGGTPYGSDSDGNYITFIVENVVLSSFFPSEDDIYNIQWFISNSADSGVIGESPQEQNIPNKEFLIDGRSEVDQILQMSPHIYNGEKVPVANPSMCCLENYSNYLENSHFVYVVYQALENNKWNIYLRQIRLSEYSKSQQIEESSLISLTQSGTSEVVYRVVCVNDNCIEFNSQYSVSRSVTLELFTTDGRDIFNNGFDGFWNGLCPGHPDIEFPKEKVFVKLVHSVVTNKCPNSFEYDSIFYNWESGDEFIGPTFSINGYNLFQALKKENDSSVAIGEFTSPVIINDISIYSSSASSYWYDDSSSSSWSVINQSTLNSILNYRGIDISEPIPISNNQYGHVTNPVIKSTLNNDICIVYQSTETSLSHIHIASTSAPSSSLPVGVFQPNNIDRNLNYFFQPSDFTYNSEITSGNNLNQLPDMFIDNNDVVHLCWQSNRDNYWEIYYANSESQFYNQRITKTTSKSLSPKIIGDDFGRVFITWHDNRFGNWEIMLAYYPGDRVLPLIEQDPYLASIRNFHLGYRHYSEMIPLSLSHSSGVSLCSNNLIVTFYKDRTKNNIAFQIEYEKYPFAFQIPSMQSDITYKLFETLNDWTYQNNGDGTSTITSLEYDSKLISSTIDAITIEYGTVTGSVLISFRASDIEDDVLSESQWTNYANITSYTSNSKIKYSQLGLPVIKGRYKQIRMVVSTSEINVAPQIDLSQDSDDLYYIGSSVQSDSSIQIGHNRTAFFRYPISLSRKSQIISANLRFTANSTNSSVVNVKISLLDTDNANNINFSNPILTNEDEDTGTYILWNNIETWNNASQYDSADVSSLVFEYISRIGYLPNNFIGLKITDNGSDSGAYRSSGDKESGNDTHLVINYIDGTDIFPLTVDSKSSGRICIPANQTVIGYLDLMPDIRSLNDNSEISEIPIPIDFHKNQTYFIGIHGIGDDGIPIVLNDPKTSVSCEDCNSSQSLWNSVSCSYSVKVFNDSDTDLFYNFRVKIYSDQQKTDQIAQFDTFPGSDLSDFTIKNNQPISAFWSNSGLKIESFQTETIYLWPNLEKKFGLLCGIKYWIYVEYCSTESENVSCNYEDIQYHSFGSWICNCNSHRWKSTSQENLSNIRDIIIWKSSNNSGSDTRITEISGSDNINPKIQIRSNGNGIIVYETNRNDPEKKKYELFASVFSVIPSYNMYSSASESIISRFDESLSISDISLCENEGCSNPENNTLVGKNVSFCLDQYDNIFMSFEQDSIEGECLEFSTQKTKTIKVHRCGLSASDLIFNRLPGESPISSACLSPEILNKSSPAIQDSVFSQIINSARILKEDIIYNIVLNDKVCSVVDKCNINIEIIGEPGIMSVRLQNEQSGWSSWIPTSRQSGSDSFIVNWSLSSGSGIKSVLIQCVNYQGLSSSFSLNVVADYAKLDYSVVFYKTNLESTANQSVQENIFVESNIVNTNNGIPIAGMPSPKIVNGSINISKSSVIGIEIIPTKSYMDSFTQEQKESNLASPVIDFIHQGVFDQFNLPTFYFNDNNTEKFRAIITVYLEDNTKSKDGLAFIIPHFKNDCSDIQISNVVQGIYEKDKYNINKMSDREIYEDLNSRQFDVFSMNRDTTGMIKHKINIRPLEDPYFIFGSPNFRISDD